MKAPSQEVAAAKGAPVYIVRTAGPCCVLYYSRADWPRAAVCAEHATILQTREAAERIAEELNERFPNVFDPFIIQQKDTN